MNPAIPALAGVALAGAALLLWLFLSAAFLLWGARLAGIERRSYGRAIGTLLLGGLASALLTAALSAAPLVGTGLGLPLGFCVSAVVMMAICASCEPAIGAASTSSARASMSQGVLRRAVGFRVMSVTVGDFQR